MKEIVEYLNDSGLQYFATIGLDGKPKVRPFQMMFEQDGKLWYCTGNGKDVYKELQANPNIELCASASKGMSWLRLSAKVVFSDDISIKQRIIDTNALVRSIYKTADNPVLEVLYLDEISAIIAEIGKPPRIVNK